MTLTMNPQNIDAAPVHPAQAPGVASQEPSWLKEIRLRATRRVSWLRQLWASHRYEGEHVLAISHSDVDRALLPLGELRAAECEFYRTNPQAVALSQEIDALTDRQPDPRWEHLQTVLGLTEPEAHLAGLGLAAALDPPLGRVFGYLLDMQESVGPTAGLTADMFGDPPFWCPGPDSALARWQIARPLGDGRDPHTTSTSWDADALLLPGLLRRGPGDYGLGKRHRWSRDHGTRIAPTASGGHRRRRRVRRVPRRHRGVPIEIELVGPTGSGRTSLASAAAARLGLGLLSVDTGSLAQAADPRSAAVREIRRALLEGCAVEWHTRKHFPHPSGRSCLLNPLTFLSAEEELPGRSTIVRRSFRLRAISRSERIQLWSSLSDQPSPRPVAEWALRPAEIALLSQVTPAGEDAVVDVCRRLLLTGTPELLTHLPLPHTWEDLVISPRTRQHLREIDEQARNRGEILEEWGLRRLTSMGGGLTALFAGPSGTGKTMAAQVLARSLGLDLYRVDLAGVVSKYIGETEKHLGRYSTPARRAPVLLLFDEADALFGKRTEVSDAHDRYANIEIDYLLQRMETFDGVAMLATNRKGDLDSAFIRRLAFMVDFAAPNAAERERLWRLALEGVIHPSGAALVGPLDWASLAGEFDLTGAGIKSAALAAAFLARTDELPDYDAARSHSCPARTRKAGRNHAPRPKGGCRDPAQVDDRAAAPTRGRPRRRSRPAACRPGCRGLGALFAIAARPRGDRLSQRQSAGARRGKPRVVVAAHRRRDRPRTRTVVCHELRRRGGGPMTVLLKGALVEYMPTFLIPTPNVIVFQYNPEILTHTWRQPDTAPTGQWTNNPIAVKGMPDESFSFKIQMDANEDIASGISPQAEVAQLSGVYTRLAALEMLLYPTGPGPVDYSAPSRLRLTPPVAFPPQPIPPRVWAVTSNDAWPSEHHGDVRDRALGAVRLGSRTHRPGPGNRPHDQRAALQPNAEPHSRRGAIVTAGIDSRQIESTQARPPRASDARGGRLRLHPRSAPNRGRHQHGEPCHVDHRNAPPLALAKEEHVRLRQPLRQRPHLHPHAARRPGGGGDQDPSPRTATVAGYYPQPDSERLDLVAVRFLDAPTGFWQLCDANNALLAGALGARTLIGIPATATGGPADADLRRGSR